MGAIIVMMLATGCTSAPEKESKVRYVEIHGVEGGTIGGKYVSESATFVSIIPMYIISKDGIMARGSGVNTSIKTSVIANMVDIEDPSSKVNETLEIQNDPWARAVAAKNASDKAAEEEAAYREKERRVFSSINTSQHQ